MTENRAKKIAANWATEPYSALGRFAKDGVVEEKDSLRKEIRNAALEARKLDNSEELLNELAILREYIER